MTPTGIQLGRPLEILLAEDSPTEALLTRAAIDNEIENHLHHVENGEQALAFLRREDGYSDASRPDLILLDLNMPRKGGLETLGEIRGDPALEEIPVIVLTTSDAERDVRAAYKLHVNCFVTKPLDMSEFCEVVSSFKSFWLRFVKLPGNTE